MTTGDVSLAWLLGVTWNESEEFPLRESSPVLNTERSK